MGATGARLFCTLALLEHVAHTGAKDCTLSRKAHYSAVDETATFNGFNTSNGFNETAIKIAKGFIAKKHLSMYNSHILQHVVDLALQLVADGVKGDFVETGTHKGGCSMLMAMVAMMTCPYTSVGVRRLYGYDSFEGFPAPTLMDNATNKVKTANMAALNISDRKQYAGFVNTTGGYKVVRENFIATLVHALEVPDEVVRSSEQWKLIKGFFKDTVPHHPKRPIALLRLDGDMYSSTMDSLTNLYPKVSPGGYVIIDDYGCWPGCQKASHDYLEGVAGLNLTSLIQPLPARTRSSDKKRCYAYFRVPW